MHAPGRRPMKQDARPLEVLTALGEMIWPVSEHDVWRLMGSQEGARWYGPLMTLVKRGLAERHGDRRYYTWSITDAGRDLLNEEAG